MPTIAIFGATGPTGRHFVKLLIEQTDYSLQCLCRNPAALNDLANPRLKAIQGNLLDLEQVEQAIQGSSFVVFTAGVSGAKQAWQEKKTPQGTVIYSKGMKNVLDAMNKHQVKRLLVISSASVVDTPSEPFMWRKVFKPLIFGSMYKDMAKMEDMLKQQKDLSITVFRPTMLVDEQPKNKKVMIADDIPPQRFLQFPTLSRLDLAKVMLNEVKSGDYQGQVKVVSY